MKPSPIPAYTRDFLQRIRTAEWQAKRKKAARAELTQVPRRKSRFSYDELLKAIQ